MICTTEYNRHFFVPRDLDLQKNYQLKFNFSYVIETSNSTASGIKTISINNDDDNNNN